MQKNIKTALMMGNGALSFGTNAPYTSNNAKQYFVDATKAFYQNQAQWSSNMVTAQAQGLDYDDFYTYHTVNIRTSALINPTTGNPLSDDWQRIWIVGGNIDYIPRGAKIVFNGNTWIVTNPSNIQSILGTSVVRRCNATWNRLDWYGNIVSEPFCYGDGNNNLSTANNVQENMVLLNAYQHACMQYSPSTSELAHNRRMILGNQCYSVRGVQNYVQEFSNDINSVHIQYFDLSQEQTMSENDDMANRVADRIFTWDISIAGVPSVSIGGTYAFTATSVRDGTEVVATEEHPVNYLWASSAPSIATINASTGLLTGVSSGTSTITCTLLENPSVASSWEITVSETAGGNYVAWDSQPPSEISQYSEATLTSTYFENGTATTEPITYAFSGASDASYTATVAGNELTIQVWSEDAIPLMITATHGTDFVTASVKLNGW